MRVRPALAIAGGLGLLLLLPAVVILALGAYGEAVGGSISAAGPGAAKLSVQPANTRLGEPIRITGRGWPAAEEISIYAYPGIAGGALPGRALALARIKPSRTGSFEIDAVLGQSLFATDSGMVSVVALPSDSPGAERVAVELQILPFANTVAIAVTGIDSGRALPDATITVEDRFGRVAATGRSDPSGRLVIEGAPPGPAILHVQLADYSAHHETILVPADGRLDVRIGLVPDPGRRVYLPAGVAGPDPNAHMIAIDRASGLPVTSAVPSAGRSELPLPDFARNRYFSYLVAVDLPDDDQPSPLAIEAIVALARVGREVGGIRRSPAAVVNFVGDSVYGPVIYTTGGIGLTIGKHLHVVAPDLDPAEVPTAFALSPDALMPALAADGRGAYVVDWRRRTLSLLDLADGGVRAIARELPALVRQVIRDPHTDSLLLLSAAGGTIYRFDLAQLAVVGDPLPLPGAEYLAAPGDGRMLVVVPRSLEIVAVNSATLRVESVVPLEEPLYWVWTAPGEAFVYAGRLDQNATISLHLLDADTLRRAGSLVLPYGVAPDS
jgi:hypothetical protein